MAAPKKTFAIPSDQLRPLATNRGACLATDRITVDGNKVGYMFRQVPDSDIDSGWRFVAGSETQEYLDTPGNLGLYDLNTIANYDPDIIPLLDAPVGSEFQRDGAGGPFVPLNG